MDSAEVTVLVNRANFDENKFRSSIWTMYCLEVLFRGKGFVDEADKLMNLRILLKESVGLEPTKEEENQ